MFQHQENFQLFIISPFMFCFIYIISKINPALARKNKDELTFIHISDTHICNLKGYYPQFSKSRHRYSNGEKN